MNSDNISWPAVIYICVAINEIAIMLLSKLMQTIVPVLQQISML